MPDHEKLKTNRKTNMKTNMKTNRKTNMTSGGFDKPAAVARLR
jgi:hypothetical protein